MARVKLIVAMHMLFLKDDQVLLLRRFNTGYEDGRYSVPAGHLEPLETIKSGAVREAREECGVDIHPENLELVQVMHRREGDERLDFFFAVKKWAGNIRNMEPDKCDELRWCSMETLPENVVPYIRQAIEDYQHGACYAEFGWV